MNTAAPVVELSRVRSPARVAEARAMSQIRRDCEEHGLSPEQTQRVLSRARQGFRQRQGADPGLPFPMRAVCARAEALGSPTALLLAGLQAVLREIFNGRSNATAYQAGVAELKSARRAVEPGGAA